MKNHTISRKKFIGHALFGAAGIFVAPGASAATFQQDKPAALKPEIVKEFVTVSHFNFQRVKEMLENEHLLLHASWDWGGGDFESGIEAAGHVGNREITDYLLSKGARYNVFLACMLGHLDVVKYVLGTNPSLLNAKGPHGFTMLHHAVKGGPAATQVADFLKSKGATEMTVPFYEKA
jgi:hypothetical protein